MPDYAILGEESGAQPASGRFTWVIDPLDGTSNYLHGFPHWCVSIALVENGEPIHGVIFDPLRNELFTASRGSGAVLNDKRIRVSERKDLAGAMLITGFPPRERARAGAQLECVRELLRDAEDIRRTGSAALDLAYVACGRADGYFEAGVKPWDIAAGVLLVREAGGRVMRFPRRRHRADGRARHRRPPAGGRQPQAERGAAEDDRVLGLRRSVRLTALHALAAHSHRARHATKKAAQCAAFFLRRCATVTAGAPAPPRPSPSASGPACSRPATAAAGRRRRSTTACR